ncbi:hypothetical protein Efla_004572 [Eimeria flavescens]
MALHTGSGPKPEAPCCPSGPDALRQQQQQQQQQQEQEQLEQQALEGGTSSKESEWEAHANSQPLVGSLIPLSSIIPEFISGSNAHKKILFLCSQQQQQQQPQQRQQQPKEQQQELAGECAAKVRRVRRDGCCFYRSYMFGVFEKIAGDVAAIQSLRKKLQDELIPRMLNTGYKVDAIEDFVTEMQEALTRFERPDASVAEVESLFNETGPSNYLVVFARLLTASELRANAESFLPFLSNYTSVEDFCNKEVEPMFVGAEQPQILALASALGFPVEIVYVDQSRGDQPARHVFPESSYSTVKLLYRPGHYDLLYV